jgi:hypothetical protein
MAIQADDFRADISPIHHQLAEEYVTLDNFYCNGEISVLGPQLYHQRLRQSVRRMDGQPHLFISLELEEQSLRGAKRDVLEWRLLIRDGAGVSFAGIYLGSADEKNVDYRIYGENYFLFTRAYKIFVDLYGAEGELARRFYAKVDRRARALTIAGTEFNELASPYAGRADTREHAYQLLGDAVLSRSSRAFLPAISRFATWIKRDDRLRRQFADYLYHYPFSFRSWDLKTSDLDRVREWKKDFETQARLGHFAQFSYIWLPNDSHRRGEQEDIGCVSIRGAERCGFGPRESKQSRAAQSGSSRCFWWSKTMRRMALITSMPRVRLPSRPVLM